MNQSQVSQASKNNNSHYFVAMRAALLLCLLYSLGIECLITNTTSGRRLL